MTKEELNGTKVWCETNEISEKVQIKLFSLGILWANTEDKVQKYKGIIIRDYLTEDSFKSSFDKHNHKEITPSQLLGETEEWKPKVGDWVVSLNSSASYKEGEVCQIGHMNGDCIVKRGDAGSSKHKKYFRPARPEEIPQEEVEYVVCVKEHTVSGFTNGKIYKLINNMPQPYDSGKENTAVKYKSTTWPDTFKPSTREAYEAQQKGQWKVENVKINVSIEYPDKEVNKCSTINTNQNECKNEKPKSIKVSGSNFSIGRSSQSGATGLRCDQSKVAIGNGSRTNTPRSIKC